MLIPLEHLSIRLLCDAREFERSMRLAWLIFWDIDHAESYNKATARVITAR